MLLVLAALDLAKPKNNPFEQRIPIKLCPDQVPVIDPDPVHMLGLPLTKIISFGFDNQVKLSSSYVKSDDDSIYLVRKGNLIKNYIEGKFEQERWTEGELDLNLPDITDSGGNNVFAMELIQRIENALSRF